jgi:hypothetical protein
MKRLATSTGSHWDPCVELPVEFRGRLLMLHDGRQFRVKAAKKRSLVIGR